MSSAEDRIKALEAQNADLVKVVSDLKSELVVAEKRLTVLESSKQQGGGKGKDKGKKGKGKGEGKKDEKPKEDGDAVAKARAKEIAACTKEGGKKGQDLVGMFEMGGMIYFTTVMEKPGNDWELLQACMDGANTEVDPTGDDRKGGGAGIAKCFIASDQTSVANFLFHVPQSVQDEKKLTLKEWAECMANNPMVRGEILEITAETCKMVAKQNKEFELFPLKQRDAAINASFDLLRSKDLIPADDSDSEDMGAMYEDAGVDW